MTERCRRSGVSGECARPASCKTWHGHLVHAWQGRPAPALLGFGTLLLLCCLVLCGAGCGNVYLKGEALTAAETSTMDAYQANQRAATQPATPAWQQAYLTENFTQWRAFVRSARKDLSWGPKLANEEEPVSRSR